MYWFYKFHRNKLIEQGNEVVGVDNINDYYDKNLKISSKNTSE